MKSRQNPWHVLLKPTRPTLSSSIPPTFTRLPWCITVHLDAVWVADGCGYYQTDQERMEKNYLRGIKRKILKPYDLTIYSNIKRKLRVGEERIDQEENNEAKSRRKGRNFLPRDNYEKSREKQLRAGKAHRVGRRDKKNGERRSTARVHVHRKFPIRK